MVVTRTGGIPLVWRAYPGNRPGVTEWPTLIDHLLRDCTQATTTGTTEESKAAITVVFGAGQNSAANFKYLSQAGCILSGPSHPATARTYSPPSFRRRTVDDQRYPGVTGIDTHRELFSADRRVVLAHSQNLHEDRARSFTGTTLSKVGRQLNELAATLETRNRPDAAAD